MSLSSRNIRIHNYSTRVEVRLDGEELNTTLLWEQVCANPDPNLILFEIRILACLI
jgi:hypothetical protein